MTIGAVVDNSVEGKAVKGTKMLPPRLIAVVEVFSGVFMGKIYIV